MFTYGELSELEQLCHENEVFAKYVAKFREENNVLLFKVTHEFGNPLALIDSTAQLMESRYPELHNIKYWDQLKSDITNLSDLLHDFSNYHNCGRLHIEPVNLFELIKGVVNGFELNALEKGIMLQFDELDKPMDCLLMYACDKVKIRRVIMNIMRNAFEATEKGDYIHVNIPKGVIKMGFEGNGREYIKIDVITNAHLQKITSSTGMGLSDAYKIIFAHNGTMTMQTKGREDSFSLYLPA